MASSRRDFLRQTGCAAIGAAALASGLEHFGAVSAWAQQGAAAATDYKALVCIFLSGGNDGNNTVVPLDQSEYNAYSNVRNAAGLAIPQASLLALPNLPSNGRAFGLHPSLVELKDLFVQRKLAVVCNVGPLVQPLTRQQYQSGQGRPYQLFSHSDQVNQWFTSVSTSPAQTGWGGRTADSTVGLNGAVTFPMITSIAGINLFSTGRSTRALAIASSTTPLNRVLSLDGFDSSATSVARRAAFDQIRQLDQDSALVRFSSDVTQKGIDTSQVLSIDPTLTTVFPNTQLSNQLKQVAKLIKIRDSLGIKRQIFFTSLGGFDTHNNQRGANGNTQDTLLQQVSQAMKAFYDATVELQVESQVTAFTLSDFGRTLQPAGSGASVGSDHAWGNHHFVMGGAVRGGDFYGSYPTLALGGPDDTDSRGRWIPTTAVDQYAATLANWYGLAASDLSYVFPLLGRFNNSNLGFLG